MSEPNSFPARLHALLAREAPIGVIFRRGPSKQVASFLWDRRTDEFSLGQWLNGRIYERRADISPDGKHLMYFAMNGQWQSPSKGSWTAVSGTPWLKAIAFYPKGDCWEGGGLFLDNKRYWLNDRYFSRDVNQFETTGLAREKNFSPPQGFGAEDLGVYYPRLMRDGWVLQERGEGKSATVFDKQINPQWKLRKIAHEQFSSPPGRGCYWDEHELRDNESNVYSLPAWEWADVDNGQLVWAQNGCLYRAAANESDPSAQGQLLQDFNAYQFKAIEAPY